MTLKKANDVRNYLRKHPLECSEKSSEMIETKDGSGVIVVYEFLFPNVEQAKIFMKMNELADAIDIPME